MPFSLEDISLNLSLDFAHAQTGRTRSRQLRKLMPLWGERKWEIVRYMFLFVVMYNGNDPLCVYRNNTRADTHLLLVSIPA